MKRNNSFILNLFLITTLTVIITSCANIVSPNGGPKDIEPPKVYKSIPFNYSTNFTGNSIEIQFNEFVVLNNIRSQLLISPPLNTLPEIKTRGKSVLINFDENLKPNATYTIFFGDAITDLTEGNPISSYEFVFSTGDFLDSLSITGKVTDAFSKNPEKDVFVMLYDTIYDSIPYKEPPYYVTRTKEDGSFRINNLRDISYKVFALNDLNNNFKFDQQIERIAFIDTLVKPVFQPIIKVDTNSKKDSLQKDSIRTDTLLYIKPTIDNLRMFQEIDSTQRIIKAEFKSEQKVLVEFKFPAINFNLISKDDNYGSNWKIEEWSNSKDSLTIWLLKPGIDSLNYIVYNNQIVFDTLKIIKNKKIKAVSKSLISSNITQSFNCTDKIMLTFAYPLIGIDSIPITLFTENDSNMLFAYKADKYNRFFQVKEGLKQNTSYKIEIKENIFSDISGNKNDSLVEVFKTNSLEDLGNFKLIITVKDTINHHVIQFLSAKNEVLFQESIIRSGSVNFKNLFPGDYNIRAIKDINDNKKWDTGNYIQKIQPEEIILYPSKVTIRANWDLEENWNF